MTEVNKRNKYPWIDIIKSFGIYLVVLGHLWYLSNFPILNQIIYSFHMPLFFILSGYLYTYKEVESNIEFIKKKFFRLALPAMIWIAITFPIFIIRNRSIGFKNFILKIFLFDGSVPFNEPCWFFISLFFVFVIVRFLKLKSNNTILNLCISIIAFGLGYLLYILEITDYFMMIKTVICMGFFIIGNVARNSKLIMKIENKKSILLGVSAVSFVFWVVFGIALNGKVSLYGMDLGRYWCFILSGLFGTFFFYGIVKLIYIYI